MKLQIKHSLNTDISQNRQSTNDNTDIKAGTNVQRAQSSSVGSDIYASNACNLNLLSCCPSLHNNALFSLSDCKDPSDTHSQSDTRLSNSLIQSAQMLDSPPVTIQIKKCNNCQSQLDKCVYKLRCTACFNTVCTCLIQCNACKKSISKYSNFEIMNDNLCTCVLKSHMAVKQKLQSQIEDEVSINEQSDIEKDLEQRLSDFDIDLENPNFSAPNEDINISHITDQAVEINLKNILNLMMGCFPAVNSMSEAATSSILKFHCPVTQ